MIPEPAPVSPGSSQQLFVPPAKYEASVDIPETKARLHDDLQIRKIQNGVRDRGRVRLDFELGEPIREIIA